MTKFEKVGDSANFLQYLKAIPEQWKTQIKTKGKKLENIKHPVLNKVQNLAKPNKYISYDNNYCTYNKYSDKWAKILEINIDVITWSKLFIGYFQQLDEFLNLGQYMFKGKNTKLSIQEVLR
jgi:hypothetical protein